MSVFKGFVAAMALAFTFPLGVFCSSESLDITENHLKMPSVADQLLEELVRSENVVKHDRAIELFFPDAPDIVTFVEQFLVDEETLVREFVVPEE